MNTADTPRNIAEVLTYLTEGGRRISDNALTREVDLPQPTITRIRNGTTAEPRSDAIEKLAAYFGLSAAQMRGEAPLPGLGEPPKARAEPAPYAAPGAPTEAELIAALLALPAPALNRVITAVAGHLAAQAMTNDLGLKAAPARCPTKKICPTQCSCVLTHQCIRVLSLPHHRSTPPAPAPGFELSRGDPAELRAAPRHGGRT